MSGAAGADGRMPHADRPMHRSLVLLPGLNNTAAVFDRVVRALPTSVQSCAADHPPMVSVEAIAQAVLAGLPQRFWLAGFSFGAYVALALLEAAPQRVQGIALVCAGPQADPPASRPGRLAALAAVEQGRYLELVEKQASRAFHPDSLADAELMQARRSMVQAYGAQRYAAHVLAAMARPDRSGLLDGSIPTLVVAASHDTVFAPAAAARSVAEVPGARMVVVPDAGHLLPMEQPGRLAALLCDWMGLPDRTDQGW